MQLDYNHRNIIYFIPKNYYMLFPVVGLYVTNGLRTTNSIKRLAEILKFGTHLGVRTAFSMQGNIFIHAMSEPQMGAEARTEPSIRIYQETNNSSNLLNNVR